MKKLICLILVAVLLLSVSVTALAVVNPVVDMAQVLTEEERTQLIQDMSVFDNEQVQIVTVETLDGQNVDRYAKNHAEQYDIGVLMLVAIEERLWCITTSEAYEGAIDEDVIDWISADCVGYLQENDYYSAFAVFIAECQYYLDGYTPEVITDEEGGGFTRFLICLVIGLAAGGITAGIMAGKNKSVRPQNSAANYVRSGSMQVSVSRDIYLYHHITRTEKPQSSSSSSSGGGGSRSTRSGGF